MARILSYTTDNTVTASDIVIGSDGDAGFATKNYRISDLIGLNQYNLVLFGSSYVDQVPSGLNQPLQVSFGDAKERTHASLSSAGLITINTTGRYVFHGYGNFRRTGSSGGTSIMLFRFLLNGYQAGVTKTVQIKDTGDSVPYEVTLPIQLREGDEVIWQIVRDSAGHNSGRLAAFTTNAALPDWGDVPSAHFELYKIEPAPNVS